MQRFRILVIVIAVAFGLYACAGEKPEEPLVRVATPPPPSNAEALARPSSSGGLPPDWYVVSNDGSGLMLEKMGDEDAWIWVALEPSISGLDVSKGVKIHRKAITDSPAGNYIDNGSIETRQHGSAVWSWGSFEGDGDEPGKNDLVLFIPYPHRDTVLSLRYVYPLEGGTGFDGRLAELVAVADGLTEGS